MPFRIIFSEMVFLALGASFIFAQVEVIGDKNFLIMQNGNAINLPFFSNHSLDASNENILKAVIVIHGANRNADDYYNSIYNNAFNLNVHSETIIIAPQFLTTTDLNNWQPSTSFAFWSGTTPWSSGGQSNSTSEHPRDYEISSFTIMDSLTAHLLTIFPNLQDIALVGNSAGGQFVNRYAAGSDQDAEGKLRYVVSAPSSFVYLDEYRYGEYLLPIPWELPENCGGYNDYKYGLDDLNEYMSMMGTDSIRDRYSRRKVQYLIGNMDVGGTQDCESTTQGGNRLERSIIYYNYLQYFYGNQILDNQEIALISGVGHDYNGIFSSECGRNAIFGLGSCEQYNNLIYPAADFSSNNHSGDYPHNVNFFNESVAGTHSIQQLIWIIDNDIIYSNGNINYSFTYPGLFDVGLIAFDQIGLSDTIVFESMVQIDTLYGDVDWDAEISENDASLILDHISGNGLMDLLQQSTGDVSNSSSISSFDASIILQYLSGNINAIPIPNLDSYAASGDLNAPEISGEEGEILTIPISIVDASNLYSFTLSFEYDNMQLHSGSIYSGAAADYGFEIEYSISESGSITVAGASSIPFDGDMLLVTLYLILNDFGNETIEIESNGIFLNEAPSQQDFSIFINNGLDVINSTIPNQISLEHNFPNPFNNNTSIRYLYETGDNVHLNITDIQGVLIKKIHGENHPGRKNIVSWDGTNSFGLRVNSGIYFYTLEVDGFRKTKKMLLLK